MMPIVIAEKLRKEWNGRTIFENVDLEVGERERVALFGPNGCGKTTLLSLLLGRSSRTRAESSWTYSQSNAGGWSSIWTRRLPTFRCWNSFTARIRFGLS
ncbi:ATP-binding cassette domain-containing protein [Gordoniibacillus kamchatkensis]